MLLSFILLAAESAAEVATVAVDGGWAAWLKEYGGWAISVVLAGVVVYMARYIVTKLEDRADPKEVREAQAIKDKKLYEDILKEVLQDLSNTIAPLITTIDNNTGGHEQLRLDLLDKLHDQLVPLIAAIGSCTLASTEMKVALNTFFTETAKKKDEIITDLAQQKQAVGDAAMVKMEALYDRLVGMVEKVVGAAATLKAAIERAEAAEAAANAGDSPEAGAPA